MKRTAFLVLLMSVCVCTVAFAGDNLTIGVSCTIPAIPGVNVPAEPATVALPAPVPLAHVQVKETAAQEEELIVLTKLDETESGTVQILYSR